jgi:VPDSG-CTERM motif
MKPVKYIALIAALAGALTLSARADVMFLGAVDFASQPNNNPDSNLAALGTFLGTDVSNFTLGLNLEDINGDPANLVGTVHEGCFIVAHFGDQFGGSLEFFLVTATQSISDFPTSPDAGDPFANNPNSLSSLREFCPPGVPDSGTTAILLGGALAGLGLGRRYLKR